MKTMLDVLDEYEHLCEMLGFGFGDDDDVLRKHKIRTDASACPANAVELLRESSDALKAHCPYWQVQPDCSKCVKHKGAPDCLASVIDVALRECGGE